jgi:hypothetical protein
MQPPGWHPTWLRTNRLEPPSFETRSLLPNWRGAVSLEPPSGTGAKRPGEAGRCRYADARAWREGPDPTSAPACRRLGSGKGRPKAHPRDAQRPPGGPLQSDGGRLRGGPRVLLGQAAPACFVRRPGQGRPPALQSRPLRMPNSPRDPQWAHCQPVVACRRIAATPGRSEAPQETARMLPIEIARAPLRGAHCRFRGDLLVICGWR